MKRQVIKKSDGFVGEKMVNLSPALVAAYQSNPFVRRLHLVSVGYFPNAVGHFIERENGSDEWIFFYCISGEGTVRIGDKTFSLSEKTAICIPSNVSHSYFASTQNPWSILWFHFRGEDISLYPIELAIIHFQPTHSSNTMLFYFDQLFNAVDNYTEENVIYASHILQMILSETYYKSRILPNNKNTNDTVEKIKNFFAFNLSKNLTLNEICSAFYLSKSYLNSLFKKNTGLSPINYFIVMKMKEACKLLRSTDRTIKHIASKLGYDDPYYFSFLFKKVVGVSPSKYKNSNLIFF